MVLVVVVVVIVAVVVVVCVDVTDVIKDKVVGQDNPILSFR